MGNIVLSYEYRGEINFDQILDEIEYGSTFALYTDREDVIPIRGKERLWVELSHSTDDTFIIEIQDEFFEKEYFWEKLQTVFLYNFLDFAEIRIKDIDVSNSEIFHLDSDSFIEKEFFLDWPVPGTIFKPYYHLSLLQKIEISKKFVSMGGCLIKEDETYMVSKERILAEAGVLQESFGTNGYYVPNITCHLNDYFFLEQLFKLGIKIVMVNFLMTGLRSIYEFKKKFQNIKVWGHRIGYIPLQKNIDMQYLAKIAVLAGVDLLHIGTPKSKKEQNEKVQLVRAAQKFKPSFRPVFTKTTPEMNSILLKKFGKDIITMTCGYIREPNEGEIDWIKVGDWINSLKNNF